MSQISTKVDRPDILLGLNEYKKEVELNTDITLDDLIDALNKFLERQKYLKPLSTKVTSKELSISTRVRQIRSILTKHKTVNFLYEYFNFNLNSPINNL